MKPKPFLSTTGYLITTCLLLISCTDGGIIDPYFVDEARQNENQFYVKTAQNVPLLTEKKDLSFSIMSSSTSKLSGFEMHGAFMPTKHLGVLINYAVMPDINVMKYNQFEAGAGYVTKLSRGWHFETYGGFGKGKIKNTHHTGNSQLNLTHYFIQPTIAVTNAKKNVQFAFVGRVEGVNFKVVDTSFATDREPLNTAKINSLYNQPFHVMFQPGIVFRFGWQKFQFHTAYSLASDLTNNAVFNLKGNLSLGILFRFNTDKKPIVQQ